MLAYRSSGSQADWQFVGLGFCDSTEQVTDPRNCNADTGNLT